MNKIQFKMFNAYFPHKRWVRPYKHMPYLAESYEHYDQHYGDLEDQPINRKTHYYSLTDHDVLLHLWSKMSNTDQWDNHYFSFPRAEVELRKQTFYKRVCLQSYVYKPSSAKFSVLENNHYVGRSAPKKKIEKWFKQNMNRFLVKKLY